MAWPTVKLADCATRIGGGTPSRKMDQYWGGELPWFTVADLKELDDIQPLSTSRESITRAGLDKSSAKLIPQGAVVFSSRVVVGKVGIAMNDLVTNQDFSSFIPIDGLEPEFLAYFLLHTKNELRSHQRGATIKGVTTKVLDSLDVPRPPRDEQRSIVSRIKKCMQRIDEMEGLQSILSEDYSALYLSTVSHVMEQLKSEYDTTNIGELVAADKKAMRSGPFGSAMKHHEFVNDGNLVIGIANVQENRFDPVRKWMITDEKFEEMKRYQVAPGDVLITIMGTIGRTCVVPSDIGTAITSKHVYRIRFPRDRVVPEFMSYVINYDFDARRQLYGTAIGGVMPGLNATKLRNLQICIPPVDIQEQAVSELDEMHSAIGERDMLAVEDDTRNLRDSVLRKAFAGEF